MNKDLIITRLRYFYNTNKRMPTYGEMCRVLNYKSKGAVRYVVKKLIEDEIIEKDEKGVLVPKRLLDIPMLGIIKAGNPIPAHVQRDNYINFHALFASVSGNIFALTVSGDSMIDAGIYEDDIVIIDKSVEPKNNDIVAANVDGEWTVKFLNTKNKQVSLLPANKKYKPIIPKVTLEIGGVVAHVIRSYR